jgi:uncharacterized protein
MPEAEAHYAQNEDLIAVRAIQDKILLGYENDFAKYAPIDIAPKIKLVWQNMASIRSKIHFSSILNKKKRVASATRHNKL